MTKVSLILALIAMVLSLICLTGCTETTQGVYDPNAPELKYMIELTDPNWIEEVGISRDSRVLFNVSVNRGIALKNQAILAEVARRVIAIEKWRNSLTDPNEVKE